MMGEEGLSRGTAVHVKPTCQLSPKAELPLSPAADPFGSAYPFGSTSPCQHSQCVMVQLESWLLNQGHVRNGSVSSEVRQEGSAERAACGRVAGEGSWEHQGCV